MVACSSMDGIVTSMSLEGLPMLRLLSLYSHAYRKEQKSVR